MPLQQIRPDFSGSAESMQQAQRGIAQVGTFANEWMDRLAKEKAVATEQARYDTEQKRLDTRDKLAKEQWDKSFGIQQAQEGRASREAQILKNTREALPIGNQEMQSILQNTVTPQAAESIRLAYEQGIKGKKPVDVLGMQAQAVKQYNASPTMQKQMLQSMALATGAEEQKDAAGEVLRNARGEVMYQNKETDPSLLMKQREGLLSGLDQQIAADKLAEARNKEFTMNYNINKDQAAETKRHNKVLENAAKEPKFEPFVVTKVDKEGTSKLVVKNQAQLSEFTYKDPKTGEVRMRTGYTMGDYTPKSEESKNAEGVYSPTRQANLVKEFDSWYKPDRSRQVLAFADKVAQMKDPSTGKKVHPDKAIRIVLDASKGTGVWDSVQPGYINERLINMGIIKDAKTEGFSVE